ncbi:MAG: hypothetical protein EOM05_03180 [Clostridia bacterium]|nr:hypothetical protein [Clostridia bacterium]
MFFFDSLTMTTLLGGLMVLAGLLFVNEITRRSKWLSVAFYIALPIILTIFVWPKTAGAGTDGGYWFAWVKTYSALAGVIGFMILRFVKGMDKNKFFLIFPGLILSINILEAVFRDFECYSKSGVVENGLYLLCGPWNIINGIAGIINIITITAWMSIRVAKTKSRDMVWADQLWFWIIAYDLWNISYCYNCISDRFFYAGFTILIAATLAEFFIKRGVWLQHRAQTLALYAMFTLTFPAFASDSAFSVKSSHNPKAMLLISIMALAANIGVLVYEIITVSKKKVNPFKQEIYTDLAAHKKVLAESNLLEDSEVSESV